MEPKIADFPNAPKRWSDLNRPLIELCEVHKSFGELEVMRGLNLAVMPEKTTVVIGESGSGKSVLIKLMNGLLLPDRGEVRLFGQNTKELRYDEMMHLRRRTGTLFQNYALFDSMSVTENIAFPLREHTAFTEGEILERVRELLAFLGLADSGELFPAELSGGMKKRVSLARALISMPEVVLFDEPTTGLDPIMIEFVDQMLMDARAKYKLTSFIISHDMASAFKLADTMAMLHGGTIVFSGTPKQTRQTTVPMVRGFLQEGISRMQQQEVESAVSAGVSAQQAHHSIRYADLPPPPEPPLVEVRELEKSFGDRLILKGVNFYILPHRITTLIGGSGSGKSVCMKHVLGLFQPSGGSVRVLGQEVAKLSKTELLALRLNFGMLFQNAALFDSMTVRDNVGFPLAEHHPNMPRSELADRVDSILEKLRILELGSRSPADISAGQRKRVGLARAIIAEPKIMIYDEPTTGLDPVMTAYVNEMIVEAQETFNVTSLVVSHDMASTFRISHRVAMLYLGHIIAFGTPEQVQASQDPRVQEFVYAGAVDS